ncbi:hypothetical protein DPMN_102586 [Dreissena polymorpha]|uniref:Uncharacterized protein n=1 Tax=Dreissena polymorpha TaxID=45954 RepID=A0A9D4LJL2_DREPO|nr:hypothetical protein DPMN_102586 [Dreissena polymorpha]
MPNQAVCPRLTKLPVQAQTSSLTESNLAACPSPNKQTAPVQLSCLSKPNQAD